MTVAATDTRVTVPLYTSTDAAGYLGVPEQTFARWVKGYRVEFPDRPAVTGVPLITELPAESRRGPTIPFGGLAEGMFLSALRRAGVPPQQIRPALDLVRSKLRVEHALASRRLFVGGAQLLWDVSTEPGIDTGARHSMRAADPEVNFGRPYFAHGGTPLTVVGDLLRSGEALRDVAGDFGIPVDEMAEFAQRERLPAV